MATPLPPLLLLRAVGVALLVGTTTVAYGACDPATFKSLDVGAKGKKPLDAGVIPINPAETTVNEGSLTAIMPLSVSPMADVNLVPTPTGLLTTTATISLAADAWSLSADTRGGFTAADLDVQYRVGVDDTMSSLTDPSSILTVTVSTRDITTKNPGRKTTVFTGYIDLLIDYGQTSSAGSYSGDLTITIGCK